MIEKTMSVEQLGKLLFKAANEPRRGQKRYLKDLGGDGSADELDRVLKFAQKNKKAVQECERLDRQRKVASRAIEQGVLGEVAEMLADVRLRMEDLELTQTDVAATCGWPPSLLSNYLNGNKDIGISNLAKLASAVGCKWRLQTEKERLS